MAQNENTPAQTGEEKKTASPSERFMQKVIEQYSGMPGDIKLTAFQEKLVQNYFIKLDQVLKAAEIKRVKATNPDPLAFTWQNVNIEQLAVDVVAYASVGMDPLQPNHINLIPYKNARTQKFDISFMLGYRGIELKAMKYGLEPLPKDIRIEIVYSNDKFVPAKKDRNNNVESYEFQIVTPFDRGEVVGGFYHFEYDDPSQNHMRIFSKAQIDKRKPAYASTEFWGGEKDLWKNGQRTGEKEKVEGWYDEMAWKTLARSAYGSITIDSYKIDAHFVSMMQQEHNAEQLPQTAAERVAETIHTDALTEDAKFEELPPAERFPTYDNGAGDLFTGPSDEQVAEKRSARSPKKESAPKEEKAAAAETNPDKPPFE